MVLDLLQRLYGALLDRVRAAVEKAVVIVKVDLASITVKQTASSTTEQAPASSSGPTSCLFPSNGRTRAAVHFSTQRVEGVLVGAVSREIVRVVEAAGVGWVGRKVVAGLVQALLRLDGVVDELFGAACIIIYAIVIVIVVVQPEVAAQHELVFAAIIVIIVIVGGCGIGKLLLVL